MIFLYVGNNVDARNAASTPMIQTLTSKRPDAEVLDFNDITFSPSRFLETIDGMGLFETKSIVICKHVLEDKSNRELVLSKLESLASSNNAYIFIESALHAAHIKKFKAHSDHVYEYKLDTKKQEFNTFALTDLLLKKDKKNLWLGYHNALSAGKSVEEIHGILVWQLRCLLLSYRHNQASSGLKPFVFNKTKRAQSVWSEERTHNALFSLVKNYHEARRGNVLLPLAVEEFILSL